MKTRQKRISSYFSIHYSLYILFGLSFFTGLSFLLIIYFLCLVFHEFFHAFVAKKLGYKIGKIKLMATGAVLEAESDEFSYSDEILISLSGPLFNLCVVILLIVGWWIIPESYNYTLDICVINLSIFCFNLIPIFPLDGGRILLALISKKIERKQAVKIVKTITLILSVIMFFLFIFSLFNIPNFSIGIMAVTLFLGGIVEDKKAIYKKTFYQERKKERAKKRGVEVKYLGVKNQEDKSKFLKFITPRFYTIFVVFDDDMSVIEYITETSLIDRLT